MRCQGFRRAAWGEKIPCAEDLTKPFMSIRIPYVVNPGEEKDGEDVPAKIEFLSLCMNCAGVIFKELSRFVPGPNDMVRS